ncbi:MAG: RnfABCDGE type electron transport complex subunit D [Termitinemataceae bacterium]|nr:MAG: RnfABCDGE type electron transport complex subunit D [Termitinemataceae bacterium]
MAENESIETAPLVLMQSSPHIVRKDNTSIIMSTVLISLLPVTVWGIVIFGIAAFLNVAVSVASAICAEALFRRITKQDIRIKDCSAALTGLLLALVIPPTTPLWMTALGSIFAVVVVKEFFGGLGCNVFNPALGGRAFMLTSFPVALTTWAVPSGLGGKAALDAASSASHNALDAATMASPLGVVKQGNFWADPFGAVGDTFVANGLSATNGAGDVIKTLFLGNHAGCIGETSIFLILIGGIFLLLRGVIDWRAPVALIVTSFVASAALGMDPIFSILSGGIVFGAVFMATDYTSAPVTDWGKVIFGIGAGLLAVLIRKYGNYPEGASYGILIMNMATPFLNRIRHRKYGFVKPVKKAAK